MRNVINRIKTAMYRYGSLLLLLATFTGALAGMAASQSTINLTSFGQSLCSLVNDIQDAVFIVALALLTLGGALYAIAHMMPGQTKGALQGYGMGMIIGGVVGVILVAAAPFAVNTLLGGNSVVGATPIQCTTMFGTITT